MKYEKIGKTKKLFSRSEDVIEGTIRVINKKLYYCTEQIVEDFGYTKTIWDTLDLNKFIKISYPIDDYLK